MIKILITGGNGFIGRYLIKSLITKGNYKITSIDNNYRWEDNIGKEFFGNSGNNKINQIKGDICNKNLIENLIFENDIIVHLAWISQVITSIDNPDLCFEYNVLGTKLIVDYSTKYKKKLIFSSSREVYGSANYLPVDLKHPLIQENPYGTSKIIGESLIKAYSKTYGLDYIIFRLSNVYGYGDKGRVVPIFFEKMMKNDPITIYGNDKIIDFVYIDDLINAFEKVIEDDVIVNKTFNIGSGTQTSLEYLAKIIINITNSKSKLNIEKNRKGEVDRFCADISETTSCIGWKPNINLETGLSVIYERYMTRIF